MAVAASQRFCFLLFSTIFNCFIIIISELWLLNRGWPVNRSLLNGGSTVYILIYNLAKLKT